MWIRQEESSLQFYCGLQFLLHISNVLNVKVLDYTNRKLSKKRNGLSCDSMLCSLLLKILPTIEYIKLRAILN